MVRVLTAALAATAILTGTVTPAVAAPDIEDCVNYAMNEADAGILLADLACAATSIMACYRLFRAEYGPQLWALTACELR